MKVKIEYVEPYLSDDGFYYKIWNQIKERLKERLNYTFEEGAEENADVIIGISKIEDNDNWLYTVPVFTRTFVILQESKKMSVWELFYKLFVKRFIPIILIFLVISVFLGELLYRYTPRKSRRNAFWQSFSGLLGAYGYVAEKLSDHPSKTRPISYVITSIILICILYLFLYLQATINTTMIFSRNQMIEGKNMISNKSYILTDAPVKQKDVPFQLVSDTSSLVEKLEKLKDYDGILVDALEANKLLQQPEYSKRFSAIQTTLGSYGVSIAVSKRHPKLFIEINDVLLNMRNEIAKICSEEIHTAPNITLLEGTNNLANTCIK